MPRAAPGPPEGKAHAVGATRAGWRDDADSPLARRQRPGWRDDGSGTVACMETWDALRARRNVRQFEQRPVPAGDLDRVLEAGWRAPSASNRQRRDFVLVTERADLERLSGVWQGARYLAGAAAAVAVVYPSSDDPRDAGLDAFDQGQAVMALMLVAADLGIGTGHSAVGDQDLARQILGYPESHRCDVIVALGYPADRPLRPVAHPARRPFDEVVHRGRW